MLAHTNDFTAKIAHGLLDSATATAHAEHTGVLAFFQASVRSHRLEKGKYTRVLGVGGCRGIVEQSVGYFRNKVISMGEHVLAWVDAMIASDKDRALRRLQGLLSFKGKYPQGQINQAARKACIRGQYTLRDLRRWIESSHDQETFSFPQQHELIRNPGNYDSLAQTSDLFN